MSGNYIKLYRSFLEWEWWHDANTSRVFLYILLMANWTDKKWKGTIIKRGSFVSSFSKIALATSLTVDQVRTAVKHLRYIGIEQDSINESIMNLSFRKRR